MTPGSANRKLDLLDNFRFARHSRTIATIAFLWEEGLGLSGPVRNPNPLNWPSVLTGPHYPASRCCQKDPPRSAPGGLE
jgi:hypothetical protein